MTRSLKARRMPPNVFPAPNRTNTPRGSTTFTARSRRHPTTGKTHPFASSLNRPKVAGNSAASTISMSNTVNTRKYRLILVLAVGCAISCVFSNAQESPSPAEEHLSISPDKKWEYKPATDDRKAQIVKAGTDEAAGDLACDYSNCGDGARVLWAPYSKRFGFYWGQGRTHQTSFYQLRGDHWKILESSPGDEASQRVESEFKAQLKRQHVSEEKLEKKGLYLRF